MKGIMYFDMDNTLNKLKCVNDVWKRLDNKDVTPYIECEPCEHNIEMLKSYKQHGYKIIILSCLSRVTDEQFDRDVTNAKLEWLGKHVGMEWIDEVKIIPYTKDKSMYVNERGTLVDDDVVICSKWSMGDSIVAHI